MYSHGLVGGVVRANRELLDRGHCFPCFRADRRAHTVREKIAKEFAGDLAIPSCRHHVPLVIQLTALSVHDGDGLFIALSSSFK